MWDAKGIADALTYAGLAATATAALLCAVSLWLRRAPAGLGYVGIGLLVLGVATQRDRTFDCIRIVDDQPAGHFTLLAVSLAAVAVAVVVVGWRRGSSR